MGTLLIVLVMYIAWTNHKLLKRVNGSKTLFDRICEKIAYLISVKNSTRLEKDIKADEGAAQ